MAGQSRSRTQNGLRMKPHAHGRISTSTSTSTSTATATATSTTKSTCIPSLTGITPKKQYTLGLLATLAVLLVYMNIFDSTASLRLVYNTSTTSSITSASAFFQTQKENVYYIGLDKNTEGVVPRATAATNWCRIPDLKMGRWVNITYDLPPYTPMRGEVHQKTCLDFEHNKSFATWIWEPAAARSSKNETNSGCNFKGSSFEREDYCRMMEHKTVAIIGDSISLDHFLSLTHLLGVPKPLPRVRNYNAKLISQVCNNTNNTDTGTNNSFGGSTLIGQRDFFLQSVPAIIREHFPDVLVLNRGAHYVRNEDLLGSMNTTLFPALLDWQARCASEQKECLLIWRTTVPGHPNCSHFTKPSESVQEMEQYIASAPQHHWDQFSTQNELVLEAFHFQHNTNNLSYEIMDAYHVNILRPDMHKHGRDCLHTCLPKDNTYSLLLNHMLHVKYDS